MSEPTFWNGEPVEAYRDVVRVPPWRADRDPPLAWWREHERTRRQAVVIPDYHGLRIVLDNEDGSGWSKVTEGHGSPRWPHKELPPRSMNFLRCNR